MKQFKSLLLFLAVFLAAGAMPAFAYDQYESMKVGETKTFYFPSEVTSRANDMTAYNCSSDRILNVEVVSYTKTSVTVKALEFTQSTVNIRFDYWWNENGYSRTDTHMVHIDLTGNSTPDSNPNLNPNDYLNDYGCWGTINIEIGETKTVYGQYTLTDPSKVVSIGWTEHLSYGFEITLQSQSSCTIKGRNVNSGEKLWCLMKYGNTPYRAY